MTATATPGGRRLPRASYRLPGWVLWLGPLLIASLALRVVVALCSDPISTPDTGDYLDHARWIAAMDFSRYTGWRTPGYPLFLILNGFDVNQVRIAQMLIGLGTVAAVFYLGLIFTGSRRMATLAGAYYGLSAVQVKFEDTILTEALTALGLVLCAILLVGLTRHPGRLLRTRLFALGMLVSSVVMVRPGLTFLPVAILLRFLFVPKLRDSALVAYLAPAFLPIVVWSLLNFALFGYLAPTTSMGFQLINHSGPMIANAPVKYAAIRDVYLKAGETYGSIPKNLIFRPGVADEMMARTGLTLPQLSRTLSAMSIELFVRYPATYLNSFFHSWVEIWNPESFAQWQGMHNARVEAGLVILSRLERALSLVINVAFLVLVPVYALLSVVRRRLVLDADIFTIVCIVLLTALVHSGLEVAEKRYGVPLQPLTILVVLSVAMKTIPRIQGPSTLPASGDARHA